ncbi:MAG: hypothetical protein QM784_32865 [Polyangiaceae bacterium]
MTAKHRNLERESECRVGVGKPMVMLDGLPTGAPTLAVSLTKSGRGSERPSKFSICVLGRKEAN